MEGEDKIGGDRIPYTGVKKVLKIERLMLMLMLMGMKFELCLFWIMAININQPTNHFLIVFLSTNYLFLSETNTPSHWKTNTR